MVNRKDQGIETLRGLAIVLMVAGHVIGVDQLSGIRVLDDSPFRYVYYSLQFLRMPLFTVISGFVYSLRPVEPGEYKTFLEGKCRRILVPLVFVSTLQFFARVLSTDVNRPLEVSGMWKIYVYPFDHFWFLQAIFLVFVTIGILDIAGQMKSFERWVGVFIASIGITLLLPSFTGLLGVNGFLYLLPYFVLGCGLCRYSKHFRGKTFTSSTIAVFFVAVVIQQLAWFFKWDLDLGRVSLLAICVGVPGGVLLVTHRFENRLLAILGHYSYSIYLFHVFGTAGCRIVLTRMGVTSDLVVFFTSLLAGLLIPVVLESAVFAGVPLLQYMFLGIRPKAIVGDVTSPGISRERVYH